jgi:hypothetical protein
MEGIILSLVDESSIWSAVIAGGPVAIVMAVAVFWLVGRLTSLESSYKDLNSQWIEFLKQLAEKRGGEK